MQKNKPLRNLLSALKYVLAKWSSDIEVLKPWLQTKHSWHQILTLTRCVQGWHYH